MATIGDIIGNLQIVQKIKRLIHGKKSKNTPVKQKTIYKYACINCGDTAVLHNVKQGFICTCKRKKAHTKRKTKNRRYNKLYGVWKGMFDRCTNPNVRSYKYYGQKGIRVCSEWSSFDAFELWAVLNGYQEGLVLFRVDTGKNYQPDNCTWVTRTEHANNRVNPKANHDITWRGRTQTAAEWETELGFSPNIVRNRVRLGWSVEKALTAPVRYKRPNKNLPEVTCSKE